MSFTKSLSVEAELTELLSTEVREVGFEIDQGLVLQTPFRDGFAKAGWLVGIGSAPTGIPTTPDDRSGSATIAAGLSVINSYPKNQLPDLWIVNNLPYIGRLNDGYSAQAPAKYVETIIARVTSGR